MDKVPTLADKYSTRSKYVKASFVFMVAFPSVAISMLAFGVDPSPASAIFSTASATFASIIVGHMATTPANLKKD